MPGLIILNNITNITGIQDLFTLLNVVSYGWFGNLILVCLFVVAFSYLHLKYSTLISILYSLIILLLPSLLMSLLNLINPFILIIEILLIAGIGLIIRIKQSID